MAKREKTGMYAEVAGNKLALAREAEAPPGEILLYQTEDGRTRVECRFAEESLWLSQALMAELFQTTPQNITQHLKALYQEGEIEEWATCKQYLQVRQEGNRRVRRSVKHYNLDAILAVGYRVRSPRGTHFRRWATERLRTAELITARADHARPNMGLTSWKGGRVAKADVTVAKNYLAADEIGELNRIVVMWLDFAEDQARRRKQVFLKDWQTKLDEFLRFNERDVLGGAGKVSHREAVEKAAAEYERFAARRRALLEAQGERDGVEALEAAAKDLERPKDEPGQKRRKAR